MAHIHRVLRSPLQSSYNSKRLSSNSSPGDEDMKDSVLGLAPQALDSCASQSQTVIADAPRQGLWHTIKKESTFFRIHLLSFAFIPLIVSGVFYACNGRFHISYLDCLFLCYSSMTVTGLSTVNLSTTTALQQVILYVLMMIGDISMVSWVMVLVRKNYFRTRCKYVALQHRPNRRGTLLSIKRTRTMLLNSISSPIHAFRLGQEVPNPHPGPDDMEKGITDSPAVPSSANHPGVGDVAAPPSLIIVIDQPTQQPTRSTADNASPGSSLRSPVLADARRSPYSRNKPEEVTLDIREAKSVTGSPKAASTALTQSPLNVEDSSPQPASLASSLRPPVQRTPTRSQPRQGVTMLAPHQRTLSVHGAPQLGDQAKFQNYGGFPGPLNVAQKAIRYISPKTYAKLERTLTISSTQTITGVNENGETALTPISGGGPSPHTVRRPGYPLPLHDGQPRISEEGNAMDRFISGMNAKVVSWLSFPLTVGRNSDIHVETLTDEQIEEVGGAEYRALRLLSYLVPSYFVLTQLFAYLLFAPWLSVTHTYDGVFEAQPRLVQKPWFALFQVMGAYTGGGLSLVDLGMVPFQSAYLMMVALMFVILAGNNALPIFLRFTIWIGYKVTRIESDIHKALEFLIDHPRRCFIYLFPSHQTWFLLICLILFSVIEWVAFEVLNIGLPAFEALSVGPRTIAGLFQGLSARASGFAIVPIANLAPAVQFMYVILMYIAVYPVALSIRSTNVYEEKSLGIFQVPPDEKDQEPTNLESLPPRERVGKYLDWHLRRQVSNDMWWLVWSVFFIAIIERGSIMDENKKWFDMFRVLFELVSAFGGIGLTLGVPYDNFSFCGAMKPLSKLIIIVVMVRGRHRGLPLAVDRAILLPTELNRHDVCTTPSHPDTSTPINLNPPGAPEMG